MKLNLGKQTHLEIGEHDMDDLFGDRVVHHGRQIGTVQEAELTDEGVEIQMTIDPDAIQLSPQQIVDLKS